MNLLDGCFWKFFYQPFSCPKANFGPLTRGHPSVNVNHCTALLLRLAERHQEPRNETKS